MACEIIVVFSLLGDFVGDLEERGVIAGGAFGDGELSEGRGFARMGIGALEGLGGDVTGVWH